MANDIWDTRGDDDGLFRRIREGERIPDGWGLAWRDPASRIVWVAPLPWNWLAGWLRRAWLVLMRGPKHDILVDAYERGYRAGQASTSYDVDRAVKRGIDRAFDDLKRRLADDWARRDERLRSL